MVLRVSEWGSGSAHSEEGSDQVSGAKVGGRGRGEGEKGEGVEGEGGRQVGRPCLTLSLVCLEVRTAADWRRSCADRIGGEEEEARGGG